jgi:hypothetical protein
MALLLTPVLVEGKELSAPLFFRRRRQGTAPGVPLCAGIGTCFPKVG